jgi:ATP-dependent RNA helicase RhlE
MQFSELGLAEPIVRSVAAAGYTTPTPIQAQAIPHAVAGKDILGCAQTGTGKTAAFSLPILHRLMGATPAPVKPAPGAHTPTKRRHIRALILSPTRELALQILDNLNTYARGTGLRHTAIFGGVNQNPQVRALQSGVDIVVATPGRLEDLMQQGYVDLSRVEIFVLDEADRMLDMGFIEPIRRIASEVPQKRQTLLFSATMPAPIKKLADALLHEPVNVRIAAPTASPSKIGQGVYLVRRAHKPQLLTHVLTREYVARALVFTRTKHGADKLVRHLRRDGIHAEAIHGNKRQNVRQRTLENFRSGKVSVLVATDIAARGIDVDEVTHVVNFDIPYEPETYVHRIGRTGRAGASGTALSFCDHDERHDLKNIERLLKKAIDVKEDHPVYKAIEPAFPDERTERPQRPQRGPAYQERRSPESHPRHPHAKNPGPRSGWQPAPKKKHPHQHPDAVEPKPEGREPRPHPQRSHPFTGHKSGAPKVNLSPLARHKARRPAGR